MVLVFKHDYHDVDVDDGEGAEDDDHEYKVVEDGNDDVNDDACSVNNMGKMKMTLGVVGTVYSACKC